MPQYRRIRPGGATWFFTVTLADRGADLLTAGIGRLREAVRATRAERLIGGFCGSVLGTGWCVQARIPRLLAPRLMT